MATAPASKLTPKLGTLVERSRSDGLPVEEEANDPEDVTMFYAGGIEVKVAAADVESHKRAGWTLDAPDSSPAA